LNAIRIQNEIKQNTYKKVREVSKFNRDAIEYIATDELTEDIYALNGQDETLWKETGGNIREITITVDKEQQQLLEEVIVVNGKEVTRCTITLLEEIKTFDPALFQANVPEGTRRIEY
jgi:outer membrane lipoprotein-sorting protein